MAGSAARERDSEHLYNLIAGAMLTAFQSEITRPATPKPYSGDSPLEFFLQTNKKHPQFPELP